VGSRWQSLSIPRGKSEEFNVARREVPSEARKTKEGS